MEDLQRQINELKLRLDNLGNYAAIPLEVQNAFALRIPGLKATGFGTFGTQTIDTSGATADVPAQPSGTIKVNIEGVTYELIYK